MSDDFMEMLEQLQLCKVHMPYSRLSISPLREYVFVICFDRDVQQLFNCQMAYSFLLHLLICAITAPVPMIRGGKKDLCTGPFIFRGPIFFTYIICNKKLNQIQAQLSLEVQLQRSTQAECCPVLCDRERTTAYRERDCVRKGRLIFLRLQSIIYSFRFQKIKRLKGATTVFSIYQLLFFLQSLFFLFFFLFQKTRIHFQLIIL